MRFLLDENLPAYYCTPFLEAGHECTHVSAHGLTNTLDENIRDYALQTKAVIVTFDLDFSRLAALNTENKPSVLTFRTTLMNAGILKLFVENHLEELLTYFESGATITVDDRKIRIKKLPF